jgi:hypothetical protein
MEFDLNLIDSGIVLLVIALTNIIKKSFKIPKRWIPLIPFIPAVIFSALLTIKDKGGFPDVWYFIAATLIETFKVTFASMGLFKIYKTTLKGDDNNETAG